MEDVVIVGAGPVGLMLACELRLAGVTPVLLDKRAGRGTLPKANGLGGEIVRMLDYRGLRERFEAASSFAGKPPGFPFGSVPVSFAGLGGLDLMAIQQPSIERLLEERATELGVTVRWGSEVLALSQDGTVTLDGSSLRARYVVGCDGAKSVVRRLAGIDFPGETDEDVLRLGHFTGKFPDIGSGWQHTPHGRAIVFSIHPGVTIVGAREKGVEPDGPMTIQELRDSVHRVLGIDLDLAEPIWVSRTVAQARQASHYRSGRVFLAGDAAHLFPAGGSSLNVGMMDAVNLGWKLAADLRGSAPDGLLDTYHAERHPVGASTLRQTRAQAAIDRASGEEGEALRGLLGELFAFEEPRRRLGELLQGSDVRYGSAVHPLVGTFAPDLRLGDTRVAEVMRAARPVLLDLGAGVGDGYEGVDVVRAELDDPPADAVLIRPDGYVAWAGTDGLEDALASIRKRVV